MQSAFGVEHTVAKGIRPDRAVEAAVAAGKKVKIKPMATPLADARLGRVGKAYTPGSITLHQSRSDIARRKKQSANRAVRTGLTTAAIGATAAGVAANNSRDIAGALGRPGAAKAIRIKGTRAGAATAIAGGALAGAGAAVRARHAHVQNREAAVANRLREQRIGKSAFGIVHKGSLAAVDDVALAPSKVKAVTATVRPGAPVPPQGATPRKPLTQKLDAAVNATGGQSN